MKHAQVPGLTWPADCPECGQGQIVPLARAGRTARHKNMPDLPVPADLAIPTCNVCSEEWIDGPTALALDRALEAAYQRQLQLLAITWLQKLAEQHVTQRHLERLLGLSQGYLSKIRSGASHPSPMLVGYLHLLATDPERRLREVESSFALGA